MTDDPIVSNISSVPFVEKYRPNALNQIISHQHVVDSLQRFLDSKKLPHLLFHGPPGTGKTSCVIALAKAIHGNQYKTNVLEVI